jgi:hypothetical protein
MNRQTPDGEQYQDHDGQWRWYSDDAPVESQPSPEPPTEPIPATVTAPVIDSDRWVIPALIVTMALLLMAGVALLFVGTSPKNASARLPVPKPVTTTAPSAPTVTTLQIAPPTVTAPTTMGQPITAAITTPSSTSQPKDPPTTSRATTTQVSKSGISTPPGLPTSPSTAPTTTQAPATNTTAPRAPTTTSTTFFDVPPPSTTTTTFPAVKGTAGLDAQSEIDGVGNGTVTYGTPLTFVAAYGAITAGGPVPTGKIVVSDGGITLCTATLEPFTGLATCTSTLAPVGGCTGPPSICRGDYNVLIQYSGDAVYAPMNMIDGVTVLPA